MTRHFRTLAALVAAAVGLVTAGVASGTNPPTPDTGQAVATIQLPRITITDATGATHTIDLGALTAQAITDNGALASLDVLGWSKDSQGGPQSGDHDLGPVQLVGYDVHATVDTAHSSLDALTAMASAAPLDVEVDLGQHGVDATVQPGTSTGAVSLTVTGLKVGMGDLLPTSVLDALPLSGLIDLVSNLGLTVPPAAGGVVGQLGALASELSDVTDAANDLNVAQSTLAALLAASPSTTAAQQQLTDAQTQLTNDLAALFAAQQQLGTDTTTAQDLITQLDAANADVTYRSGQVSALTAQLATLVGDPLKALQAAQVSSQLQAAQTALNAAQATATQLQLQVDQANATVTSDQTLVTSLTQQVSSDQAAVTAAQTALDALAATVALTDQAVADAQTAVDQLTTTLTDLVDTLDTGLAGLPDLTTLRTQLVAALTAAPLIDVGTLGATVSSTAADGSGSGSVTCTVTGASVLGQAVPVGPCSDLVSRFAQITSAVSNALAQLPLAQSLTPVLGGLTASTAGTSPAPDDVDTTGGAAVTPLHLALPSGTLAALTDPAVAALAALLGPAQTALSGLGLPALTTSLTGSLGTFGTALAALPSGSGLAGLHTLGVDVSLLGLSTSVVHHRSLPAASPPAGGGGTGPVGGGGSPGGSSGGTGGGGTTVGGGGTTSGPAEPSQPAEPPTKTPVRTPPAGAATPPHHAVQHSPLPALPFTGDNAMAELAAALVLLLAGMHVLLRAGGRPPGGRRSTTC